MRKMKKYNWGDLYDYAKELVDSSPNKIIDHYSDKQRTAYLYDSNYLMIAYNIEIMHVLVLEIWQQSTIGIYKSKLRLSFHPASVSMYMYLMPKLEYVMKISDYNNKRIDENHGVAYDCDCAVYMPVLYPDRTSHLITKKIPKLLRDWGNTITEDEILFNNMVD
jgi:hypothetical protein